MGQAIRTQRVRRRPFIWGSLSVVALAFAAIGFALDQSFKWWLFNIYDIASRTPVGLLPFFDLVLVWNRGISYGWLTSHAREAQWVLVAVSVVVSLVLWVWCARTRRPITAAALGLVVGGALANGLDRVLYGAVADFFHFHVGNFSWYVFNLADVAIVAGAILLFYESVAGGRRR
jgi:signal peptidase II